MLGAMVAKVARHSDDGRYKRLLTVPIVCRQTSARLRAVDDTGQAYLLEAPGLCALLQAFNHVILGSVQALVVCFLPSTSQSVREWNA